MSNSRGAHHGPDLPCSPSARLKIVWMDAMHHHLTARRFHQRVLCGQSVCARMCVHTCRVLAAPNLARQPVSPNMLIQGPRNHARMPKS